ncbi:hypothetical protein KDK_10180 [Dictyobacter kobayashii]|uniref:Uncharacterized protein n=1 Tax=Dictyobacter kobayashii TaxID=2014872 RepID=A0A402ADQ1_9CHLR|nr:hypothetical protein KDK_10180 [Dictyobacter kobayashii]
MQGQPHLASFLRTAFSDLSHLLSSCQTTERFGTLWSMTYFEALFDPIAETRHSYKTYGLPDMDTP